MSTLSRGTKSSATLLMQYRRPVGAGPSSNTWPKWPSHAAQTTSMRRMPWLRSMRASTAVSPAGWKKLGQPLLLLNLVPESNSRAPQLMQT